MMVSLTKAFLLLALPSVALGKGRRLASTPDLHTDEAGSASPTAFTMKSRVYIPYNNMADGLGFGMGAAEQIAYDDVEKYAYAISEQGYINVVDWNDATAPAVLSDLAVDLAGVKLTDIEICSDVGVFFVGAGAADTVSNGKVHVFHTVKRADPMTPTEIANVEVGPLPDMLLPNSACTKVAVANEGEGDYNSGLVDPAGSVMILSSTDFTQSSGAITQETISLSTYSDEELKAMGVHLPLEEKAMEYWDDHSHIADDIDFSAARASYSSGMNLEPEYLAWSYDETTLFVNLQENNAVASISVPESGSATLQGIHGLGMKDHSTVELDIVEDDACNFATYAGLHALRMPDSIQAIRVDCVDYIITANEGDDKGYGDWEEKWKLKDLIDDDMTMDGDIMNMNASSAAFATATLVHNVDSGSLRITVGSSAVNYSDPTHPIVEDIVIFGGRGLSIFKYEEGALSLEWDSGKMFEKNQCDNYPWAHNSIQDEEFAPKWGVLYNSSDADFKETLDDMNDPGEDGCDDGGDGNPGACPLGETVDERSLKDGSGTEAVVAGMACGRLIAVTATEKQGTAFVYDVTNPTSPSLLFVQHLSVASETKNPGVAYADGTLGEIDPEAMIFLDACHSPSGQAGVMFGGAWSGTMSFWEFTCPSGWTDDCDAMHDHDHCGETTDGNTDDDNTDNNVSGADRRPASFGLLMLAAIFSIRA